MAKTYNRHTTNNNNPDTHQHIMDDMVHTHTEVLFIYKTEQSYIICRKMDGIIEHVKLRKPNLRRPKAYFCANTISTF